MLLPFEIREIEEYRACKGELEKQLRALTGDEKKGSFNRISIGIYLADF